MEISIGWWLVPAVITLVAFVWFNTVAREDLKQGGMMSGLVAMLAFLAFVAITGVSWAVYFAALHFTRG